MNYELEEGLSPISEGDQSPNFGELEEYTLIRSLGKGSFAEVFLGIENRTGKEYALKVYNKEHRNKKGINNQIEKEIHILSALKHKNIVLFYKTFVNDNTVFLVMEYLKGGNLKDFIDSRKDSGGVTEEEASIIIRQISQGLSYLHEHTIIHRDLKLENLIFKDQGNINSLKIIDFGLSAYVTEEQRTFSSIQGTPLFLAPEMFKYPNHGKPVDVWSLGIILYMTLNNESHPFYQTGDTAKDFYRRMLLFKKQDSVFEASQLARDIFNKMTKIEPSERYGIDQVLAHPWITRKNESKIPLTHDENIQAFCNQVPFMRVIKSLLLLSFIKKQQERSTPEKKKNLEEEPIIISTHRKNLNRDPKKFLSNGNMLLELDRKETQKKLMIKMTSLEGETDEKFYSSPEKKVGGSSTSSILAEPSKHNEDFMNFDKGSASTKSSSNLYSSARSDELRKKTHFSPSNLAPTFSLTPSTMKKQQFSIELKRTSNLTNVKASNEKDFKFPPIVDKRRPQSLSKLKASNPSQKNDNSPSPAIKTSRYISNPTNLIQKEIKSIQSLESLEFDKIPELDHRLSSYHSNKDIYKALEINREKKSVSMYSSNILDDRKPSRYLNKNRVLMKKK